jgi:hypothetical protein
MEKKTDTEKRKALYDAARALEGTTHIDAIRDVATALAESVELPEEFDARAKAADDAAKKAQPR